MARAKTSRKRRRDENENLDDNSNNNTNNTTNTCSNKREKKHHQQPHQIVQHVVLTQYYAKIQTLRDWVLSKLPKSSKIRRRKVASVGLDASTAGKDAWSDEETALGELLDTTLVAIRHDDNNTTKQTEDLHLRWEQWIAFSQGGGGDESYVTLSDGGQRGSVDLQSEMIDYVIWLLFSRESSKSGSWPKHMLCDGFRKNPGSRPPPQQGGMGLDSAIARPIPGVFQVHPNHCVKALKEAPWPQFLTLLGKAGQRIMLDLLLDCAVFVAVKAGKGNFNQLSGIQISELDSLAAGAAAGQKDSSMGEKQKTVELRPSEITFVKSRMMYARAALNARGLVHFGLRHIHVLNRFPISAQAKGNERDAAGQSMSETRIDDSAVHLMMYMFPRQFGLHNVFTSVVDRQQTAQKFQDYTLREEEIGKKFPKTAYGQFAKHVPKRLRGKLPQLIQRLQVLHGRCSYAEMLQHYCPVGLSKEAQNKEIVASQGNTSKNAEDGETQNRSLLMSSRPQSKLAKKKRQSRQSAGHAPVTLHYDSLVDLATPVSSISAFCQAVLSKIIPHEFWGHDSIQEHNKAHFLKKVHQFICLRRFESMCLHELMQGMKITDIDWLKPPKLANQKCSQSDIRKRTEIFYEFLYYLFDSLLIPLIRSNFYVTESNTHRYRVFFFRHDIWRQIAEPAMAALKAKMFEEVRLDDALRILGSRKLGFSQVRLLPKRSVMRPIMNLRRRTLLQGNQKTLGPSINSVLGPVSNVLKLEKSLNLERLGGAMFSVGDIYQRIKAFKANLLRDINGTLPTLYFAKVDVQAAFDTIPQDSMVELLDQIPGQSRYKISKHVELQPLESCTTTSSNPQGKPTKTKTFKRWHSTAKTPTDQTPFASLAETSATSKNKQDTVFVGSALEKYLSTQELLSLTKSHIKENLVKVGKKYYRQRTGIPQGSVLSSILCNYFYADLEGKRLGFLRDGGKESLLMRLIDDFLLVTTDRGKAERFVKRMYEGFPEWGVEVGIEKSLVNWEMHVGALRVPQVDGRLFPYCGLLIDIGTLEVGKERDWGVVGGGDTSIFNSLTVEFSRCPGMNFKRKVLNAFKIQSHLMFFDTSHNSPQAVLSNVYTAFLETATKTWAYARCLGRDRKPTLALVKETLLSLVDVAWRLLTSSSRRARYPGYVCSLSRGQVAWLVMRAFGEVLGRKQAGWRVVVGWIEGEVGRLEESGMGRGELSSLRGVGRFGGRM